MLQHIVPHCLIDGKHVGTTHHAGNRNVHELGTAQDSTYLFSRDRHTPMVASMYNILAKAQVLPHERGGIGSYNHTGIWHHSGIQLHAGPCLI